MAAAVAAALMLTGAVALASPVSVLVGPSWRTVYRADLSGPAAFTDIVATGRSNAWAVGARFRRNGTWTGAIAAHWNGRRWRLASLPVRRFVPETVAASSATNVWIFGFRITPAGDTSGAGVALQLVHGKWQPIPLPTEAGNNWNDSSALHAAVFSPGQVWLSAGVQAAAHGGLETQMWQWTGTNWAETTVPGILTSLTSLSGSSVSNMWATTSATYAGSETTHSYKFVSSSWQRQRAPVLSDAGIAVHSRTDIWIAGFTAKQWASKGLYYSTVAHWNGVRWRRYEVVAAGGNTPAVADGRGGFWAGPMLHEIRGRWYEPASGWLLGSGCEPAGFFGNMAGIPGTSAWWAAGGCTPRSTHRAQARISINGKL
jgi:hypothetical protein